MDPISLGLTSIRNNLLTKQLYIDIPRSNRLIKFLLFLIKQGCLCGVSFLQHKKKGTFRIYLKYYKNKPVISGLFRISRPSRRIYINKARLQKLYSPYLIYIISTKQGYMNAYQALQLNIGGEFIGILY